MLTRVVGSVLKGEVQELRAIGRDTGHPVDLCGGRQAIVTGLSLCLGRSPGRDRAVPRVLASEVHLSVE